jgi:hypothetical protein
MAALEGRHRWARFAPPALVSTMSRSILAFIVIGLLVTPLRARGTSSS